MVSSLLCSLGQHTEQAVLSLSFLTGVCLFAGRPGVCGPCNFSLLGFVRVFAVTVAFTVKSSQFESGRDYLKEEIPGPT